MACDGPRVRVHPEVADALAARRPVVALETAVLTTGLPRSAVASDWTGGLSGWRPDGPAHLESARLLARTVRDGGAVPAVIGVLDGVLGVGLEDEQIEALAADADAGKAAARDLAFVMAAGASAGTTVSATLAACRLAGPEPIRVFATGGIGGVHRSWTARPDVSADLAELARTPCCVVCTGAKSILDPVATLEALEALGVPFFAEPDEALRLGRRLDDPAGIAAACRAHWQILGRPGGVLAAVPPPAGLAIDRAELEQATRDAESAAAEAGVTGPALTPFLLSTLAGRTAGRTLRANVELLRANAAAAASLAVALAG
jgi:pseudouridine-5'-phosphate glycosidase